MKTHEQYQARANVARAMAHASRLMMLDLMHEREMCVSELTAAVGADQSTVSKHLAVLREAGLVDHRREGTANYYRVTCGCLDGFFACLENVLRSNVEKQQSVIG